MSKKLGSVLISLLLISLLVGCDPVVEESTVTPMPPTKVPTPTEAATEEPPAESEEVILTITGSQGSVDLTMTDLMAIPTVEGWGGIKNSVGNITVPALYTGIALKDLVELVGGISETDGLNVVAEDGYAMTLAYSQVFDDQFITYDPGTGDEIDIDEELVSAVVFLVDGEPLPQASEGTLRLAVLGSKNNQVTDGHWWVKWVREIGVKDQGEEWFLSLEGAIAEEMDRATFESCSSPSCHGTSWTDDEGHEWLGTPLYLIGARVDDENKHDFGGFNVELAEAGYSIQLVASDGYTVEIASGDAMRNENMIVAIDYDGEPLPEKFYPLRLVGADLERSQMVGQVTLVHVLVPPGETAEPVLTITGMVGKVLALSIPDLESIGIVQITAEHPKNGATDYEGVRLNDLLAAAAPGWEATTLRLIADDGFTAEVSLEEIKACADCLIAIDEEGKLSSVMPGMTWVKGLVGLEITAGAEEEAAGEVAPAEGAEPAGELPQAGEGEEALTVFGLVNQELALSMETLQGLDVIQIDVEHPKKGMQSYEGVLLNDLLNYAAPTDSASTLVLTASDGFAAEVPLADVLVCTDCLVAFDKDGTLDLVMAGMESNFWVKNVIQIEVK